MLERACRAWGARPLATSIAAAIFAFAPLAWRLASEPEVFMLNAAIALLLVALSAPMAWEREERRAIALAFVAGLGLSNHHSIVLLAPLGLFAWGRAVRRTERRGLAVGGSVAAFALGLLPYAYLMHAAADDCSWGDTSTITGLVHHFLRRDYGTTRLSNSDSPPEPLAQLVLLARTFFESIVALPLIIAAVVAVHRRRWSWDVAALSASLILAGPVFVSRFNLPPRGLNEAVVVRFHLLPLALAAVLGAQGIDALIDLVRTPLARRTTLGAAGTLLLLYAGLSGADVIANHRPTTERYLRNVLTLVPPHSVIVAVGDDLSGGLEYMQCVLGERRDVVVLAPYLMLSEPYARSAEAKLGFPVEHGTIRDGDIVPSLNGTRLVEQLVMSDRPVFLTAWFLPNLERLFPSYPIGPLIRLTRSLKEVPAPPTLLRQNEDAFSRMTLDDTPPFEHTWAGARYADYARPWKVMGDAFERDGDQERALACRARAEAFLPLPHPSWP